MHLQTFIDRVSEAVLKKGCTIEDVTESKKVVLKTPDNQRFFAYYSGHSNFRAMQRVLFEYCEKNMPGALYGYM
jgi:hypothetical protein